MLKGKKIKEKFKKKYIKNNENREIWKLQDYVICIDFK